MQLSDFDYALPETLIAQSPLTDRSASRLMVLKRAEQAIEHAQFEDLPRYLKRGDLLVLNDTRVIPARLIGSKKTGGHVEFLLVKQIQGEENLWQCLTKSSKSLRLGENIQLPGEGVAEIAGLIDTGERLVRFTCPGSFIDYLEQFGHMPLPPYIKRSDQPEDHERYQTIFAAKPGAIAAPTAGLHFTPAILADLVRQGVEVCTVTLHVGPGTFLPVRHDDLSQHKMHAELFDIPESTATSINRARAEKRRIIAVGTTVTRTLEAACDHYGQIQAGSAETDLFIKPGFPFKIVDALVTNFHLPRSTLLILTAAFAGRDLVLRAYRDAVDRRYRFFSYGDCTLIV
ncbi:MAG: tRNA preQ1(34) S-adenosylmethionine ribosyltransferase-isomerase QueA [Deltaproteobacteria bacterium]|jgi:S-adenosylmethionine:tRNA ribosyltransferase-isomerase|nr:tRNA preQ1(34) S-adenosylmethionine ribosyltransferase-isomerase QueA [Deltaproteobacteria bacterium]